MHRPISRLILIRLLVAGHDATEAFKVNFCIRGEIWRYYSCLYICNGLTQNFNWMTTKIFRTYVSLSRCIEETKSFFQNFKPISFELLHKKNQDFLCQMPSCRTQEMARELEFCISPWIIFLERHRQRAMCPYRAQAFAGNRWVESFLVESRVPSTIYRILPSIDSHHDPSRVLEMNPWYRNRLLGPSQSLSSSCQSANASFDCNLLE